MVLLIKVKNYAKVKAMSDEKNDSFIRWQGRAIEQLGFVNNLLIGLSTGLLVFQTQLAFNDKTSFQSFEKWLVVPSIVLVFASLVAGCYVAWNRLRSFRNTAKVARMRSQNQDEKIIKELRTLSDAQDQKTWWFLPMQAILFALGSLLLLIAAIVRYLQ